ncbi:zinc finger protein 568-like [Drosophila subpulchrella]|uniref:zinc finger protein 568-like n=1 Tax=Drosophila subpulchrella TaxID=1486046 RepID=UPI0018A12C28|nr:zinc finger protein 568-like [Drosophila subpulchrella]
MDFKYHNKDVVLEIKGSDALFHNTSILDVLKSLKELSEPARDANSGRVPKRRREEEEPKTPGKKGRKSNSFEELEATGSSQTTLHPHSPFEELEASGSSQTTLHPHSPFEELEASGSSQTTLHPHSPFEELEASGSSQTTLHPHSPFEELEASGSSQTTLHPHSPFEELEASGSSQTTLHGSPETETLAHSSPLQPLSHIRNTEDLKAGEVSWFPQAKTWGLNVDEIRKVYRDRLERVHDCFECGVILHSHKALAEHEKLDDHVQEKKRIEKVFNSKVKSMCPICGAKAGNKTKLRNHVIRHFRWTFDCKQCPKLFCSIRRYRDHRHPPISKEKKYACECGCTFVEKRNLRLHKSSFIHRKRMPL